MTALTVSFHGHTHTLIEHGGEPHVAMRPVVEAIGLSWSSQMQRIKSHPVMGTCVLVTNTQMPGDTQRREIFALPLKYLNGWLFGVDSRRVKAELRQTLVAYQRECFEVLDRHWRGGRSVPLEMEVPAVPGSVQHRADHIVSATRIFRALLRTGRAVAFPQYRALASANEATLRATGYDLAAELGFESALRPPAIEASDTLTASAERFAQEWRAGNTPFPFVPASSAMVYSAYQQWCRVHDIQRPCPVNQFRAALVEAGIAASPGPLHYLTDRGPGQARFFLPPLPDNVFGTTIGARLGCCEMQFADALVDG